MTQAVEPTPQPTIYQWARLEVLKLLVAANDPDLQHRVRLIAKTNRLAQLIIEGK